MTLEEKRDAYLSALIVAIVILVIALGWTFILTVGRAEARDVDGRYAGSPLKSWFDGLKSGKGPCCSDADGTALSDVDWEAKDGHYRVRMDVSPQAPEVDMQWIDVPDDAVITEPNRYGRTMVWPIRHSILGAPVTIEIRCFMPGAGI